jgi:hypothetical protein
MELPLSPKFDSLGALDWLYFAALLMAQEQRLPVGPTLRTSVEVLDHLRGLGLIEVPWPETHWDAVVRCEETPIERLQWRRIWSDGHTGLLESIQKHLRQERDGRINLDSRLQVWRELAAAEAERYFEQQLIRHQFDSAWARDLTYAVRDASFQLSIAQWRYCCWAATRHGASVALRGNGYNLSPVREAIFTELGKRAHYVGSGAWNGCSFPPSTLVPQNALARIFASDWTQLDADFWVVPPESGAIAN